MKTTWCYELMGVALFLGSTQSIEGTGSVISHGSLLVAVPTSSGLVVCTDKREWNRIGGASDTETKIYPIDSKAAFTITGSVAVLDPSSLLPIFSVKELATKCLKAETKRPLAERIHNLPKVLNAAYKKFEKANKGKLEQSSGAIDDVITSITVWYASGDRVHVSQIQLHNNGGWEFSYKDPSEEFHRKFYIEGQTEFIVAAIRNSDPRFKAFKTDPDIQTVWTSNDPSKVPHSLAIRFARKIILATNESHHLVSVTPTMVSAEPDCSLMNPSSGFEWLK